MGKKLKVLFLSRWYPNRTDAMSGLFVRNHAEAVSRKADVCVLYPCYDSDSNGIEIVDEYIKGIREVHVYCPSFRRFGLHRPTKILNIFRAAVIGWRYVLKNIGRPDIIHANVMTRHAVWAWLLSKLYGIPYVVTEHWSRYKPGHECFRFPLHKQITQFVARRASCIMPVSDSLCADMQRRGISNQRWTTICNVVEDFFFYSPDKPRQPRHKKRFVNVTCFDEKSKNIKGILRATRALSQRRQDFEVILVGYGPDFDSAQQLARELDFPEGMVQFTGELTPRGVQQQLQEADAFLMFSNYENNSVAILEACSAGLPIVTTPCGTAELDVGEYGIIVPFGDEAALTDAMSRMIDTCDTYDPEVISSRARLKYDYNVIGNKFMAEYEIALKK